MKDLPLVSLKIYVKDLSVEEVIGFNAYDKESQEKLAKMLKNANDKPSFYKAIKYNEPFIFKLNGVTIDVFNDTVKLRTPCGYLIAIDNVSDELLNVLEMSREETLYVKAKAKKIITHNRKYLKATEIKFIVGTVDLETAKDLMKDYKPYELLTLGFGYKPIKESYGLLIPRLLSVFRPQNIALHVMSFTPPNTGKSTFANLLERLWSAYYYTETPSLPQLVGDGRFNTYGVAYYYKTLIFDEFDKLGSLDRQKLEELWRVLQTGMEQGIWKRAVSSKGDINYRNVVSLLYFGNVTDDDLLNYMSQNISTNHRERLEYLIREKYKLNVKQFMDRLVYVEYLTKAPTTDEILNAKGGEVIYLEPKVTRGILKIIDELCFKDFKKIETERAGRKSNQINAFYTVLTHLGLELDQSELLDLYNGNKTFLDYFSNNNKTDDIEIKVKSDQKYEELDEMTLKEMLESKGW